MKRPAWTYGPDAWIGFGCLVLGFCAIVLLVYGFVGIVAGAWV